MYWAITDRARSLHVTLMIFDLLTSIRGYPISIYLWLICVWSVRYVKQMAAKGMCEVMRETKYISRTSINFKTCTKQVTKCWTQCWVNPFLRVLVTLIFVSAKNKHPWYISQAMNTSIKLLSLFSVDLIKPLLP